MRWSKSEDLPTAATSICFREKSEDLCPTSILSQIIQGSIYAKQRVGCQFRPRIAAIIRGLFARIISLKDVL